MARLERLGIGLLLSRLCSKLSTEQSNLKIVDATPAGRPGTGQGVQEGDKERSKEDKKLLLQRV